MNQGGGEKAAAFFFFGGGGGKSIIINFVGISMLTKVIDINYDDLHYIVRSLNV